MNIDIIITAVLLVLFVVIVAVFIFSLKDYITNVDEKVDYLKNDYVPLKNIIKILTNLRMKILDYTLVSILPMKNRLII